MAQKPKISIIIPAYNEQKNLENGVLEEVEKYLKTVKYSYEVLIVDDKSTDNTVEMAKKITKNWPGFKVVENEHGGKAVTVMSGLLKSTGEIALFTDMDQATPLSEVEKLLPYFDKKFDIVFGSRSGRKGAPIIRKVISLGFVILRAVILGLPFKDTQCGFKAFKREAVELVFPKMLNRWQNQNKTGASVNAGFDVETLYIAKKHNLKIAEVAVNWHHVGSERVNAIKDAIEAIQDLFRIRLNDIQGKYQ
jgi:dolichyl-phosphate beta-glucosyltransferase